MCNQNEWIVREAFRAYDRGDVTRMMDFVDPEVDWTYRDPELEDSARVCGAGLFATLRRVVVPLTRPSLAAVWTLVFVLAMQEVSASILLYTSRSTVLAVAIFDLWEAGNVNALAALGVMQLGVTFVALLALAGVRQRATLPGPRM